MKLNIWCLIKQYKLGYNLKIIHGSLVTILAGGELRYVISI